MQINPAHNISDMNSSGLPALDRASRGNETELQGYGLDTKSQCINFGPSTDSSFDFSPLQPASMGSHTNGFAELGMDIQQLLTVLVDYFKNIFGTANDLEAFEGAGQLTNSPVESADIGPSGTSGAPVTAETVTQASGTQPANSLNVKDFGVEGNGVADDQVGLQKAMDAAKTQGKTLWMPEGTYNHSGVLTADGVSIQGAGPGSELHATNPDQAAIKLTGNSPSISNIKTTVSSHDRSSQPDASAILVQNADNAVVTNCTAIGASANGIRLDCASNALITHNLVSGTNADGIALMNGSTNNQVKFNVVDQAGDDAFSSDSYIGEIQNSNNLFEGNLAQNSRYGRAFVSMGGEGDVIRNNYVDSEPDHCPILVGTDANSGTLNGSGGVIEGNQVRTAKMPSVLSVLGRPTDDLANASSYSSYKPGTGPGANNTAGNRT